MSNAIKTLPRVVVGTTPVQVTTTLNHKWASVSIQADPSNTGTIYVGDNNVSATRYSRALAAADWFVIAGSAVDPSKVWLVASAAGQNAQPSGS